MKVAVIGLGAIGGLVAGYLKAKGLPVIAVGRPEQKKTVENEGFIIDGVRGQSMLYFDVQPRLTEKVDLAILTVKTQDLKDAVDKSRQFLTDTLILSTQNGVRADKLLSLMLGEEHIISSIVMFGATYTPFNKVVHNFEGQWLIGRPFGPNDQKVKDVAAFLNTVLEAVEVENIFAMKWTKLFVNFSNCLPALLGKSMQETYADLKMCELALKLLKEGFTAVEVLGIQLASMPNFDLAKFKGLTQLPVQQAAPIFSQIMTNLSKEPLFGSILQSIQRDRLSEIDYINGEIANQAKTHNCESKLNTKITALVHRVEKTKKFLTKEEVFKEMGAS
ncbi:MAG: 2-dehydropantoate 2-reductase [Candidatus Omnitrophota bacterium]